MRTIIKRIHEGEEWDNSVFSFSFVKAHTTLMIGIGLSFRKGTAYTFQIILGKRKSTITTCQNPHNLSYGRVLSQADIAAMQRLSNK